MMLLELRAITRGDELFTPLMSRPIGSEMRDTPDETGLAEPPKQKKKIKSFTPIKHVSHGAVWRGGEARWRRRGGGEVAARWRRGGDEVAAGWRRGGGEVGRIATGGPKTPRRSNMSTV